MTDCAVDISGGFAEVGAGTWLMSHSQPTAFFGKAVRRPRRGLFLRDRQKLDLVETSAAAKCAFACSSAMTRTSLGPAIMSMPVCPKTWRFASAT